MAYSEKRLGVAVVPAALTAAKVVGIDLKTPAQHIAERTVIINSAKARALAGDSSGLDDLWRYSWRLPPRSNNIYAVKPLTTDEGGQGLSRVREVAERAYDSAIKELANRPAGWQPVSTPTNYPQSPINLPGGGVQQPPLYGSPDAYNTPAKAGLLNDPLIVMGLIGSGLFLLSQLSGSSSRRR